MTYLQVYLACVTAIGWISPSEITAERFNTCVAIGTQAVVEDVDMHMAIAVAYTESRFSRDAVSPAGARGPMQVKPVFHCPGGKLKGCDLITAGLRALKKYIKKYKRWPDALCHWNSGNKCYRRSRLFARIVLKRRRALSRAKGDPR